MDLLGFLFLFYAFAVIVVILWSSYDQRRFTRFEGNIKRGMMIWSDPLPWETRQFLESMSTPIRYDQSFIREEGREILISEEESKWSLFSWRTKWVYVAYINLNSPESRIEFRMPWSSLISMVLQVLFVGILFSGSPFGHISIFSLARIGCFLLIFLAILAVLIPINHYRERKRLLDILNQAMGQKS